MPGQKLDGASVYELLETEGVTFSAAVPTVWQMLLQHLRDNKLRALDPEARGDRRLGRAGGDRPRLPRRLRRRR